LELYAGIPAAFVQKRLGIVHLQDFAKSSALVVGVLVIRFNDAISDPVAEEISQKEPTRPRRQSRKQLTTEGAVREV
jgi:hypothetical protein